MKTAEEILKEKFGGAIGKTYVYITDKEILLSAMEEYANLKQDNWININDKLPDINERVLVIENDASNYTRTMIFEGFDSVDNQGLWCEFFDGYEVGNSDEVHTHDKLEVCYKSRNISCWKPLPKCSKS